ncbi:MAG: dihydroorotate dehydrogenase [Candidatus Omnitrophica bacterium]|nr:dihydroorotate dehydrogenase [Candidatus Omnitrophota bacterium]
MSARDLSVTIGGLRLANPVMVASGTFGYAEEFKDMVSLKKLGALVTKTVTLEPRAGNLPPRTCETPAGMLNAIGLENPGLECFIADKLPFFAATGVPVIVSVASEKDPAEFLAIAERLRDLDAVTALELNISCPNLSGDILISQDARATFETVQKVRGAWPRTLITKLSPNVTSIGDIAAAAEKAGSDAIALINTLTGLAIDVDTRRPKLSFGTGGLSGPAIRPVAVRMVREVFNRVQIPLIGMGGIDDTASAVEFIIAGAAAVGVGTANFINPRVCEEIIAGLDAYLKKHKLNGLKSLIGAMQ